MKIKMTSIKELSSKLNKIKNLEENKKCFECGEKGTTYICINFGTFICSRCAGLLRELNFKVKGISVSIFNQKEIEIFEKKGNKIAKKIWMGKYKTNVDEKPNPEDDDSWRIFLDKKYKFKKWYKEPKNIGNEIKKIEKNNAYEDEEEENELENENNINKLNINSDNSKEESPDNKYENKIKDGKNNFSFSSSNDEESEKRNKKNSKNKGKIKKRKENIKKDKNKIFIKKSNKEKNIEKEENDEEFEPVEENKENIILENNIKQPMNPTIQQKNNNLMEIFSYYNSNNNNSINNINIFNNNENNLKCVEFDFTNSDIPENKERIEYQNRINKLEDALRNLNSNSNKYKSNRVNMNANYQIMFDNNIKNSNNMDYINYFNNKNISFNNSLFQLNSRTNNFNIKEQAESYNPFTFI